MSLSNRLQRKESSTTGAKDGTPKTLNQAIRNGIENSVLDEAGSVVTSIEAHVIDYLAQKFNTTILRAEGDPRVSPRDSIRALWKAITGEDK